MIGVARPKLSFTFAEAAVSTGYSVDVIRRAVRAGDLASVAPIINGRNLSRPVIVAAELERWLNDGVPV